MKPAILFDIDRTIFDTDKFHALYTAEFLPLLKVSCPEFETARKAYSSRLTVSTDFLPADYLKHLAGHFSVSLRLLRQKYYQDKNFQDALFPDVLPCISRLRADFSLGIFSEGYPSFQIAKLKKSGIWDFFSPQLTSVHRRKMKASILEKLPTGTIIVDDKPEIVELINTITGLTGILIDRRNQFSTANRITSLDQLPALLHRLSEAG